MNKIKHKLLLYCVIKQKNQKTKLKTNILFTNLFHNKEKVNKPMEIKLINNLKITNLLNLKITNPKSMHNPLKL